QQPEGMRFCSRCGFTLSNVALLLENEGALPQQTGSTERLRISRNRIIVESVALTALAWAVAFLAMFWFDAGGPFEGVAKGTTVIFGIIGLISLLRFLYGFLMTSEIRRSDSVLPKTSIQDALRSAPATVALPPQTTPVLSDYPLRTNTKEMLGRP